MQNPINYLNNASFQLVFKKLEGVVYNGKSVELPSVSLGTIEFPTNDVDIQIVGEKLTYSALSINFFVDENLNNWVRIFDWMDNIRKEEFLSDQGDDATLIIYNRDNKPIKFIDFHACIPISLGGISFNVNESDVDTIASITLEYDKFIIRDK